MTLEEEVGDEKCINTVKKNTTGEKQLDEVKGVIFVILSFLTD